MLLKLTNAVEGREGDELILNSDMIISFFENKKEDGTKVTVAYGVNNNTWEVLETVGEIMERVKNGH